MKKKETECIHFERILSPDRNTIYGCWCKRKKKSVLYVDCKKCKWKQVSK